MPNSGAAPVVFADQATRSIIDQIVDCNPIATFVIDSDHRVTHWNMACAVITGISARDMIGTRDHWRGFYPNPRPLMVDLIVDGKIHQDIEGLYEGIATPSSNFEGTYDVEGLFPGPNGDRWLRFTAAQLMSADGKVVGAIETLQDVTVRRQTEDALRKGHDDLERMVELRTAELREANRQLEADMQTCALFERALRLRNQELTELNLQLEQTRDQLLHSEKMASVGQLAAGVAHEINNPIGYVQSNLGTLERYLQQIFRLLGDIERLDDGADADADSGAVPAPRHAIRKLLLQHDLAYLREDIPALVLESQEGISRVKKIVQDLKDFSHVDRSQDWTFVDLHPGFDTTLSIASNELKYRADVVKEYGQLPEVECLPSQVNQVFMNLVVNAAQAMGDKRGTITVRTLVRGANVCIEVADDANGIAPENLGRIFDPFFTTKPVGQGTGLGLSLSYGIMQKHHGSLDVRSELGVGTTFIMTLPIRQPVATAANCDGAELVT